MSEKQTFDGEQLLEQISRQVFIVVLHVGWPKLKFQITDAVVAVAGADDKQQEIAAEFRTNPQWDLMPAAFSKKLTNLEGRMRTALSSASIQFSAARGMSVLPISRAAEVFQNLRLLRTEMEQQRDLFVAEYANTLKALKEKLGDELYEKASRKLPGEDEIASKFNVVWAIIPAGGRSNVQPAQLDILDRAIASAISVIESAKKRVPAVLLEAQQELLNLRGQEITQLSDAEANELVREAKQQMNKFTKEMLEDLASEPREMLKAATDNLIEALQNPDRIVRNGTIEQVKSAFQMVEGFSFLAGSELLERMRNIRARLNNVTPQALNSNAELGAQLAVGLRGVRDAAADASAASQAMRNFRGIRIREQQETERPA